MTLYEYCNYAVSQSKMFFRKEIAINNHLVELFSHRFFDYSYYKLIDREYAKEIRGIIFRDKDTVFLSMPKFFAINQKEEFSLESIGDEKIVEITEKADGSLITPFIVDNKVYYKTKNSFNNGVLDNLKAEIDLEPYSNFIKAMYNSGYDCLFEYVSPRNKIVVDYKKPQLLLTKVRNRKTRKFIPLEQITQYTNKYNIPTVMYKITNISIKEFYHNITENPEYPLYSIFNNENFEGFVILTENGNLYKVKTKWYLEHHGEFDFNQLPLEKQKYILRKHILDETIDDMPENIIENNRELIETLSNEIIAKYNEILTLIDKFKADNRPIKDKAQDILEYKPFSYIIFKAIKENLSDEEIQSIFKKIMLKYKEV